MKPPKLSFGEENQHQEFEQALLEVEQALVTLKERYNQVQADRFRQTELQQRLKQLRHSKLPEDKAQLKEIKQQLEVLELNLESQLFSWASLKEPFWQAIRFGGLGVIIGWLLKSVAG
ncbi:MAG: hypothetical protein KME57_15935 [Scytonema hyalinum WJT4-NPBG1]|jgi:chromosome segregation ATPase|nr:hypothetical protein [Scytonema hyalinum WJT4-NPBG1]